MKNLPQNEDDNSILKNLQNNGRLEFTRSLSKDGLENHVKNNPIDGNYSNFSLNFNNHIGQNNNNNNNYSSTGNLNLNNNNAPNKFNFPLFTNWNKSSNNINNSLLPNNMFGDNGNLENKNRPKSQELGDNAPPRQKLSFGVPPLLKNISGNYRSTWDNGLVFNMGNLGLSPIKEGTKMNNHKSHLFNHHHNPSLDNNMDEIPKSPIKLTPSTGSSSSFHQWALTKSNKNNNQEQSNERFADTDFSEHVEHPSRTLFVRNLANHVDLEKLKDLFEKFGPIRNMYTQAKYRGFVMISFYDIRHAKAAKTNLQSKKMSGKKLDIHFALPKDTSNGSNDKVVNQGTLVVFNLDATITNEQLIQVFGNYGEIKDIRETPNKKSHKFIEFYDVRDAQKALIALNKTQIGSKTIKIEPSRPGKLFPKKTNTKT